MPDTTTNNTNGAHPPRVNNRKNSREDRRRNNNRPHQQHARQSATDLTKSPPKGWTAEVVEFEADPDVRKRLRMLVLRGEYGWRVLPFVTVRIAKKTTTDAGVIEVEDDLDILPRNVLEAAMEINVFREDTLTKFCESLADLAERQAALPPPHKRPLTQRPFEVLEGMSLDRNPHEEGGETMAKKSKPRQPKAMPQVSLDDLLLLYLTILG